MNSSLGAYSMKALFRYDGFPPGSIKWFSKSLKAERIAKLLTF